VRELAPNTVAAYENALRPFAEFCETHGLHTPAAVKVRAVGRSSCTAAAIAGFRIQTVNQYRAALVGYFRFLRHDDIVLRNPAEESYSLRRPRKIPDFLTVTEQAYVLRALGHLRPLRGRQARGGPRISRTSVSAARTRSLIPVREHSTARTAAA
jgi:site-specific recombinase XerD